MTAHDNETGGSADARFGRNPLVIRALLLAAAGLLVAGAVTPLLTTRKFYLFSNTFSLLTGLRELVVTRQLVVAFVIALFCVGVPVVKLIVMWMASSQQSSEGKLLTVADKLGKWSMLEVFVAALLIVAMKLGPVVDADLHYGAYLLAGSVVLSGLASQLVTDGVRAKPLFAGAATLTVGAVIGAICMALLIGILNPQLLSRNAEARCIQRVLQIDRAYAETSASEAEYARKLREIDAERCPNAFRAAFRGYAEAWERLVAHDAEPSAEPSLLERAGAWVGIVATRADLVEEIEEHWGVVEREALSHGVTAPGK